MDESMIQSKKLIFTKTKETDLDFILQAEKENVPYIDSWTKDQHLYTIQSTTKEHIIVTCLTTGKKIGYIIMTNLDDPHGSFYLKRIVIIEKRKGFGREALKLLKKWCFQHLDAHRLYLDVKDFNEPAQKLYEREGFTVEGVARECRKEGNRYISLVSMSILKQEYRS